MNDQVKEPDNCAPLSEAVELGEVHLVAHSRGQYPGIKLPEGALPGLRTIGYWDAVGPQSWGLPMHRNEGIEICYVLSGETPFKTYNGEWMLHVGEITHACRVGKSYLTSACRYIFNATQAEQVNRIRLNHARDLLLQNQDTSVTDIAFATGFNTSQYFASCFKKQFGKTPQVYRKEQS